MKAARWAVGAVVFVGVVAYWRSGMNSADSVELADRVRPVAETRPLRIDPGDEVDEETQKRAIREEWAAMKKWLEGPPVPSAEQVKLRLKALRERWAALDGWVMASELEIWLREPALSLPVPFEVGAHGLLEGWSTTRVFLLDCLTAADPDRSAEIARGWLKETKQAEEYVVAMRTLTREGPGQADSRELSEGLGRLLAHRDWYASPAFAEGLDLARVIGTPTAAKLLMDWSGERELKRMALDEFAADHPLQMLEAMASNEAAEPMDRANWMARVDPADGLQRKAVDAYFRRTDLSEAEVEVFLKTFPLRSATTGYRLYGDAPTPYGREAVQRGDRAALEQVEQWMQEPDFSGRMEALRRSRERLSKWVESSR